MCAITLFLAPRGVNYLNVVTNRQKRWHLSCTDWFTGTKFYRTKSVLRVYGILLALREIDCTLRLKFWNKNARKRFHWKTGKLPLVKVTRRSSKMKCYVKLALKQTHINFQYTDGKKLNKQHKHAYRQHGLEDLIKFKQESALRRSWKCETSISRTRNSLKSCHEIVCSSNARFLIWLCKHKCISVHRNFVI